MGRVPGDREVAAVPDCAGTAAPPGCRPSRFPGAKAATAGSSSWHVWSDGIQGKKQTPGESRETVIFKAGIVL